MLLNLLDVSVQSFKHRAFRFDDVRVPIRVRARLVHCDVDSEAAVTTLADIANKGQKWDVEVLLFSESLFSQYRRDTDKLFDTGVCTFGVRLICFCMHGRRSDG